MCYKLPYYSGDFTFTVSQNFTVTHSIKQVRSSLLYSKQLKKNTRFYWILNTLFIIFVAPHCRWQTCSRSLSGGRHLLVMVTSSSTRWYSLLCGYSCTQILVYSKMKREKRDQCKYSNINSSMGNQHLISLVFCLPLFPNMKELLLKSRVNFSEQSILNK
jgi:hypothetical protein